MTGTHVYTSSECDYSCFKVDIQFDHDSGFVFLIPYGTWKSPQELAGNFNLDGADAANDTLEYSSANNNAVQKIRQLQVSSTAVYVQCTELSNDSYL